jgi:rhodanese-related sulfurtransferase
MPTATVEELKAKLDAGANIAIVDTRATKSYERSRIAGAFSIPIADLQDGDNNPLSAELICQRYGYLSSYDEIVTYCA